MRRLWGKFAANPANESSVSQSAEAPSRVQIRFAAQKPVSGGARTLASLAAAEHVDEVHGGGVVEMVDDLPDFAGTLYKAAALRDSYHHAVCPIEIQAKDGKRQFALVLQETDLQADFVAELVRQLVRLGYAKASPLYYFATNTVMLQLARGEVTSNRRSESASKNWSPDEQSTLLATFVEAARFALKNEASDIHIELHTAHRLGRSYIKFGINGRLVEPSQFIMPTQLLQDTVAFLYNCKSLKGSNSENTYNQNLKQQCQIVLSVDGRPVEFRWASAPGKYGSKIVLRVVRQPLDGGDVRVRSLAELGYLPDQVKIVERAISVLHGGTVIAGVTGSGKSTTLQTVMSMVPRHWVKYTVEEPIEFDMGRDTFQMQVSRSLDDGDEQLYGEFQRQLMRMAPDVCMVSEVRDRATANMFRYIAGSGHRGFTTTHAPSALDIVFLRLLSEEFGVPKEVVATPGFLNLLVYQALLPTLCPHCCVPATGAYEGDYLDQIERLFAIDASAVRARNQEGCEHCRRESLPEFNGLGRRTVVAEMVEVTEEMLPYFRENRALELSRYVRSLRTAGFDEADSTGKSALEVAMYHVACGTVDPKSVEGRFGSFASYERNHQRAAKPVPARKAA